MREEGPITLVQTACGAAYEAMLAATDRAHRAYCEANDVRFWSHVGVIRGPHPWQASFNRIEMLNSLAAEGYRGWVAYLDADAVIRQPDFDLRRFLGKRSNYGLVICAAQPESPPWEVNDGVFFLNLGNGAGRMILRRWHALFRLNVTDQMLTDAVEPWQALPDGRAFPDDQHLLQIALRDNAHWQPAILLEDPMTMNHRGARFIRQYLRAHGSHEQRLEWIREAVSGFAC
jgi:hypothetical protein